jgi:hypothetical protein
MHDEDADGFYNGMIGDQKLSDSQIRAILADYPKAIPVYEEIADFYGDSLHIVEALPGECHSSCGITPQPNGGFKNAWAEIITRSDPSRLAAMTIHEFLHLRCWSRGFAPKMGIALPPTGSVEVHAGPVLNIIHHEIFYEDFVSMGLPVDMFLGRGDDLNLAKEKADVERDQERGIPENVLRVRFNEKYFRFWISNRHIGKPVDTDSFLAMGAQLWPTVTDTASAIHDWVQRGRFRNPGRHGEAVNELFAMIGLPLAIFQVLDRCNGVVYSKRCLC